MEEKEVVFDLNKNYVFDLPTYLAQEGREDYLMNSCWVDVAHGLPVRIIKPDEGGVRAGFVEFIVIPEWCVEV